jgi:FAD/FMN-containing dehydrogenase
MYDDHTFKIGVKFFKDFLKDKGFFGAIRYALRFVPEVLMAITGGVPKLIVMAEFVNNNEEKLHVEATIAQERIAHLGLKTKIVKKDASEEKFWDFRHDSFKLLTEHSKASRAAGVGTRTAPFIDDIAVNPEHLPEYLPRLIKILDEYKLIYTIAGHLGDGNFHIIPLLDMTLSDTRKSILEITDRVYSLALQYGGTLTAEHNDGIIRTPYLEQQFGPAMVALFAKVKRIFDPLNIFNPGKKVGMKKGDITKYVA